MCSLALLLALFPAVGALRPEAQMVDLAAPQIPNFDAFLERFSRSYAPDSEEYALRRGHYQERAHAAELQNMVPGRLWDAGVSHLWDWTHGEFSQLRGYRHSARPASRRAAPHAASFMEVAAREDGDILTERKRKTAHVDVAKYTAKHWELDALHPVDQGSCGSCWAVAAATVLEAHAELAGLNRTFSSQHMVNCVPNPNECGGKGGCDGATVELAFLYAETTGTASRDDVPYVGKDATCMHQHTTPIVDWHWAKLPENEYAPLLAAIHNDGPVAVSVAAEEWMMYASGIFDGCTKNAVIDHAVVLVGFGTEDGVGYWQLRNSWTKWWGEGGHIRLARSEGEATSEGEYCGTDNKPEDGTGCKGGEPSVRVCGMCGILYDTVMPHF